MRRFIAGIICGFVMSITPLSVQAGQSVEYTVNGTAYQGYGVRAAGVSKGLVLVVHDWDGLTEYEFERAEMLAALGYDTFALDLYGKGNRPKDTQAKKAEVGKLYKDREAMRTRLLAGLAQARSFIGSDMSAKTAVMGYCFGGSAILELARSGKAKNIAGYTTFHGGLSTPQGQSYPTDTPPILITHGGADKSISMTDVADLSAALEGAGINYEIQVYSGAPHAFTVFGSSRYRKVADEQSWSAFKDFLGKNL